MKARMFAMLALLVSLTLLLPHSALPAAARQPVPGDGFQRDTNDCRPQEDVLENQWFMPEDCQARAEMVSALPLATGGPDDFGYTWDDSVPLGWISAAGGIDTGMSGTAYNRAVGPIPMPFPFKYYENTHSQLFIAAAGYVAFTQAVIWDDQDRIPSPTTPNNVVAPYWTPTYIGAGGWVRYLSGGSAPNRYFVVEWHDLKGGTGSDLGANELYRFEVILHENGDIVFQYQAMTYNGSYWCGAGGIEDARGIDGLGYVDYCDRAPANKAVRFYRPAPSARVSVWPRYQGRFTRPGQPLEFEVPVRNIGELGTDTFDLFVSSPWPLVLYAADDYSLLADTDGDGTIDTGALAQGAGTTFVARMITPVMANVGDDNVAAITIRSSLNPAKSRAAQLQTAIPAPFAQAYRDDADGAMTAYLAQPHTQMIKKASPDGFFGYETAVAERTDGFVYFWRRSRQVGGVWVGEIEYTLLDDYGATVRGVSKLTDHSGATIYTQDLSPAVAVAPSGRIGVGWVRYLYRSTDGKSNYNVYVAVLDQNGNGVVPPTNITNNSVWGDPWNEWNIPYFDDVTVAATDDNRFVLAWPREVEQSAGYVDDIYYAVRDTSGTPVRDVTKFTNDTPGWADAYWYPNLATLKGSGRVLMTWTREGDYGDIYYAVLDSAGNLVLPAANLSADGEVPWDWQSDAAQVREGNVVVAWLGGSYPNYQIRYAVLNPAYNRIAGPTTLNNPAALKGDGYVSVASAERWAVLTWMDYYYTYRPNLYYALLDSSGTTLTNPTIFRTSQAAEPNIVTSYVGYGNTSYGLFPPTTDQVDALVMAAELAGGPPGGIAAASARVGNHGLAAATSVELSAQMDSHLGYANAWPPPASVGGNTVTWSLPDLGYLGSGSVVLYTTVPSAPIGTRYPLTWTVTSAGPEANPADNAATTDVLVAHPVFLPLVLRGY